jgi:hypothetical protein
LAYVKPEAPQPQNKIATLPSVRSTLQDQPVQVKKSA